MEKTLELKNINKTYYIDKKQISAINGVTMNVEKGEFVAIMGPSGCGKTTLLNIASGIDVADSGSVILKGDNIAKMRKREVSQFRKKQMGIVFQDYNLIDSLSVKENIMLPMELSLYSREEIDDKISEKTRQLKIERLEDRYIHELSGGEQQRVAICRAIINNPSILFADEPTGSLDSRSTKMVLDCFKSVNCIQHCAILLVTHDAFAASFSDRVLFMLDGRIIKEFKNGGEYKTFYKELTKYSSIFGEKTYG